MRFQLNIDKLMFETDGVWDMPLLRASLDIPRKIRRDPKKHGFRWSPTQEAWQRQLTPNAEYSIDYVIRDFNKLTDNT